MSYPLAATSGTNRAAPGQDDVGGGGDDDEGDDDVAEDKGEAISDDVKVFFFHLHLSLRRKKKGSGGVLVWNLVEGQVVRRLQVRHLVTLAMDDK